MEAMLIFSVSALVLFAILGFAAIVITSPLRKLAEGNGVWYVITTDVDGSAYRLARTVNSTFCDVTREIGVYPTQEAAVRAMEWVKMTGGVVHKEKAS